MNSNANSTSADDSANEQTKAGRVYQDLRRRIRELDLAPSTQLRKNELAIEFGVSRAPISEALARLANEGLVEIYPQSGSFVAPIREQDIRESMIIRTALEVETIRRATEIMTPKDIEALEVNLALQLKAYEDKELARLDELDTEFHTIIVTIIDCPRLQNELDACRARLDRQRFRSLREPERPYDTIQEHMRIFDAIRSGDAEYAGAAMRAHLNYVNYAIERWIEANN